MTQWIHSFVTDDKIYCIYFAPDESLIIEHGRRTGLPVDRVSAVRRLVNNPHEMFVDWNPTVSCEEVDESVAAGTHHH